MIIQCPSCSTKFAVDSTQLADVENPRFHCSRCDHFFEHTASDDTDGSVDEQPVSENASDLKPRQLDLLGSRTAEIAASPAEPAAHASAALSSDVVPASPSSFSIPFSESLETAIDTLSAVDSEAPDSEEEAPTGEQIGFDELAPDAGLSDSAFSGSLFSPGGGIADLDEQDEVVAEWPDAAPGKPFEADLSSVHGKMFSPLKRAVESARKQEESADSFFDHPPRPVSSSSSAPAFPPSFPPASAPAPALASAAVRITGTDAPVQRLGSFRDRDALDDVQIRSGDTGSFARITDQLEKPVDDPAVPVWQRKGLQRKTKRHWFERYSVPVASAVPVLLMAGVWGWSLNLTHTPSAIKEWLHLEPAGLPELPPPGLEVVDLRSALVTLDDGDRVLEIRGNILNATMKTFGRVKLEAKIFDQNNRELDRIVVDSHSSLANAKIEALSSDALMKMQDEASSAFVRLSPNERVPFRIVFAKAADSPGVQAIQWYSTRVYSTEPTNS